MQRSHECEVEWGGVFGKFGREESKGRNSEIKIQSQK